MADVPRVGGLRSHAGFGDDAEATAVLSVASQAFIDRVFAFDGFRQISTIGLGVGFGAARPGWPIAVNHDIGGATETYAR
jgi:formate hydrogenlyase subunit 3/multisubunit Na+/H+ antiporter MnhD subunit